MTHFSFLECKVIGLRHAVTLNLVRVSPIDKTSELMTSFFIFTRVIKNLFLVCNLHASHMIQLMASSIFII